MAKNLYSGDPAKDKNRKAVKRRTQAPVKSDDAGSQESPEYLGVFEVKGGAYEAVVTVRGEEISGGIYDSAEEAARAHDAMARMYHGADVQVNFPVDPYTSWQPPQEQSKETPSIPVKVG